MRNFLTGSQEWLVSFFILCLKRKIEINVLSNINIANHKERGKGESNKDRERKKDVSSCRAFKYISIYSHVPPIQKWNDLILHTVSFSTMSLQIDQSKIQVNNIYCNFRCEFSVLVLFVWAGWIISVHMSGSHVKIHKRHIAPMSPVVWQNKKTLSNGCNSRAWR